MSDFNSDDEDFVHRGIILDGGSGSNGYTTARTESFHFGTKGEFSKVIAREETENHVFSEEGRGGARNACKDRGIKRSKDSVRTGPTGGGGGGGVTEERKSGGG